MRPTSVRTIAVCLLTGATLIGAIGGPAGAQGTVSSETEIDAPVALDPTDFDPVTITDTEVSRMRTDLMSELLTVELVDQRSARLLAEAGSAVVTASDDLAQSIRELDVLESTLGAAAIEGYISDSEAENATFFDLAANASALFADETTSQLLARRAEAREAVDTATGNLERAERTQRIATARKLQSERSIELHAERQEAFDGLVDDHERAADRADSAAEDLSDEVELRAVAGGLIVNAEIEHEIDRMIADARADGLVIGGGGYRTIEAQIGLRLAHCGGSLPADIEAPAEDATPEEQAAYAALIAEHQRRVIYEVPSGACSPPTATPGNSEHQLGLAIDITEDGAILDRNSDTFAWLVEHAETYGLINLPSEAWHWSTTGS